MHKEFKLAFTGVIGLIAIVVFVQSTRDIFLIGIAGVGMTSVGGFLIAFGFWGADYAFSVKLGELDQSNQLGKVKGESGKVYVPFMRNYTPTEWWNLNWFLTMLGAFCLAFGTYFIGMLMGSLGL